MPSDNNKHHHKVKGDPLSPKVKDDPLSPVPPPRELILASPDLILTSKSRFNLENLKIFFECLGPKQILIDNKRTT